MDGLDWLISFFLSFLSFLLRNESLVLISVSFSYDNVFNIYFVSLHEIQGYSEYTLAVILRYESQLVFWYLIPNSMTLSILCFVVLSL